MRRTFSSPRGRIPARLWIGMVLLFLGLPRWTDAEVLGFWSFAGGELGETVGAIGNSAGSGSYSCVCSLTDIGSDDQPIFSAEVPLGQIAASARLTQWYRPARSISISLDPAEGMRGIALERVTPDLQKYPAWTLEYWIRLEKGPDRGGAGPHPGGRSDEMNADQGLSSNELEVPLGDQAWHHLAWVYSSADGQEGLMTLYWDRVAKDSFPFRLLTDANARLVLSCGGRIPNCDRDARIHLAGLRISTGALAPEDFLRILPEQVAVADPKMGRHTIGYWPLKDGNCGTSAQLVTNACSSGLFDGRASGANGGVPPQFHADAPGAYVYADAYGSRLLAEHPQSLHMIHDPKTKSGGQLVFDSIGSALTGCGDYTLEFFFKGESDDLWRTVSSLALSERSVMNFKINAGGKRLSAEVLNNPAGHDVEAVVPPLGLNIDMADRRWHHLAFVYTAADQKSFIAADGETLFSIGYPSQPSVGKFPWVLGTSAFPFKSYETFGGKIASPRVSNAALPKDQWMMLSDRWVQDGKVVFAYSFDEGAEGETVQVAESVPSERFNADWEYHVCGNADLPRFSADRPKGRVVKWGSRTFSTNRLSLACYGYHSAVGENAQLPHYAGTEFRRAGSANPLQNPKSWTMEAFVKARYPSISNSNGALIFGKCGNADPHNRHANHGKPSLQPRFCWLLTRLPNGNLKLLATESDGSEKGKITGYEVPDSKLLDDGGWHHLALTYDHVTRAFSLFADYRKIGEKQLVYELFDGPFEYEFSRNSETSGFEGWLDEIRFSNQVRQPGEMVSCRFVQGGTLLSLQ